jgi:curli biogenesis system outer membrane secretion channel CsgG
MRDLQHCFAVRRKMGCLVGGLAYGATCQLGPDIAVYCVAWGLCWTTGTGRAGRGAPAARADPVTKMNRALRELPPPERRVAIAVYGYTDQTGQLKESETVRSNSRAVTQGATSVLTKAL